MTLADLLSRKKTPILARCFNLVVETYPADTSSFLKREKDRFINPVGSTISQEMEAVYDELLQEMNSDKLADSLDNIIKIRSVQDFSPSQAVAFVFLLKQAIREELEDEIQEKRILDELLALESQIDKLALLAFDIYMQCREKIHEIRLNEVKAERERAFKLLERINKTYGNPEDT